MCRIFSPASGGIWLGLEMPKLLAESAASAAQPATPPPGDIPRATFDDMGLRVGDRMQLAPPSSLRGEPCMVRLIGYVRDLSLLVSAPPPGFWPAPVIEGDNVVMRVFSGRSAFGFVCQVDRIIKLPFEYLHLSFPRMIAGRVIRRSRRVKCSLPVTVDGAAGLAATITNLSSTGAEIRTDADVTRIDVTDETATGVTLASGEQISARAVVSGADPKRTLLGLVDPIHLEPGLVRRVQNIRGFEVAPE
jgi:hypothetical protein